MNLWHQTQRQYLKFTCTLFNTILYFKQNQLTFLMVELKINKKVIPPLFPLSILLYVWWKRGECQTTRRHIYKALFQLVKITNSILCVSEQHHAKIKSAKSVAAATISQEHNLKVKIIFMTWNYLSVQFSFFIY